MKAQDNKINTDDMEVGVMMLVKQYASTYGITFSSSLMSDPKHQQKVVALMVEALSGKRGAFTDADVKGK